RRLPLTVVVAAALLSVLAWPVASLVTGTNLDASWQAGLNLAWDQGVAWGGDLVFTYGPLGLLTWPALWFGHLAVFALVATFVHFTLLAASLVLAARRGLGVLGAVAAAYAVLAAGHLQPSEAGGVLAAVVALLLLLGASPPRRLPVVLAGAGSLAGVELLVKFTGGTVAVVAAVLLTAGLARGWRDWAATAGGVAGTLVLLWLVLGQSIPDLPGWIRGSAQIGGGFTDAMWLYSPDGRPPWDVATAVVLGASLLWLAARAGAGLARRRRLAAMGVTFIGAFVAFKAGFVRHDLAHAPLYAAPAACYAVALCAAPRLRLHALVTAGAALLLVSVYTGVDWVDRLDPKDRVTAFKDQAGLVVRPSRLDRAVDDARRAAREELAVPPAIAAGLADGTRDVNVDPVAISAVWAYGWRWNPVPTMQRYSGYTAYLDLRNAEHLRSAEAPDVVLREAGGAIDGRLPAFESPGGFLALLCGYRQTAADGRWQRLDRVADRCSAPTEISRVRAAAGEAVPVPFGSPGEIVYVRIDASRSVWARFRALAYRPSTVPTILLDGRPARFVVATAGQPHVLRVPAEAGWAPEFDGGMQTGTVAVDGLGAVGFRFSRVTVNG
ncbi:MAG: hypothetical protein IT200_10145, partial [Thermoleophilia bacterium]|nr:hypothetical protein [Thermoleophilia bacterium]